MSGLEGTYSTATGAHYTGQGDTGNLDLETSTGTEQQKVTSGQMC